MQEVDATTVERSWVVIDEPGARQSSGDIVKAAVSEETNGLQTLGSVLLSPPGAEGRGGRELTLFKSVGVAIQDVATGAAAATLAAELGIGVRARL
jgi:ornithine cyclodeaminase/alanine dehydrogenase-like protein (mu-crystallin family)